MSLPNVSRLARCGSHQPTNGAITNSNNSTSNTAPKSRLHHFCTAQTPVLAAALARRAGGSRPPRWLLGGLTPPARQEIRSSLPTRAVDLLADLVGQHRRIRQGLDEVDQVPHLLRVRRDRLLV